MAENGGEHPVNPEGGGEELKPEKPDIRKALSIIPSASALKQKEKPPVERRIRLKYDYSLKPEEAKIHPALAKELGVEDKLEVVVAGRHRFILTAIIDEGAEPNRVHVNPDLMEEHGVSDNSIATVRAHREEARAP